MEPSELRLLILQALLDWERSGTSDLPQAGQLAASLGTNVHDIIDQLDILEAEAAIEVQRTFGDGSSNTAIITGVGKRMAEEMSHHQNQSLVRAPLPEPTSQALELLKQVAGQLWTTSFDIVGSLRKYSHALRLLGWEENWVVKELNGYSDDEQPPWRKATGTASWVSAKGKAVRKEIVNFYLTQPLSELNYHRKSGVSFRLDQSKNIQSIKCFPIISVDSMSIQTVLNRIGDKLFDYTSKATVTLGFGQIVAKAFQQYQESVSKMLVRLGIEDYLKTAYQNLLQDNEASWQAAVLACRNIMDKLSDMLWQLPQEVYPYLKAKAKNGFAMRVTRNEPRNRIRAYLHQKGIKSDDIIVKMIDPLYAMASSGKSAIGYEHAQRVIVYTYIFVGEITKLTDMEPVTELRRI